MKIGLDCINTGYCHMDNYVYVVIVGIGKEGMQDVALYYSEADAKAQAEIVRRVAGDYYVRVECWEIN